MEAFPRSPSFTTQIVSSTAELLSGVTQLGLRMLGANDCWLTIEGGDLRYRWDGTSPSTTVGHLLPEGTPLRLDGRPKILSFRMCGDGGSSVTVSFTLFNSADAGGIV